MNPIRTLEKDLQLHWVRTCDSEIARMANDSRSKKKLPDGKNESSGSGSGSGIVRKSQRLENKTVPAETPSPKKKPEKTSPLRRSGRENKFQSSSSRMSEKGSASKSGVKQQKGSNSNSPASKGKGKDMTVKEIVEESNGKQSPNVGTKRKTRLNARCYKDMFQPSKKKSRVSECAKKKGQGNREDAVERKSESNEEGEEENIDRGGSDSEAKKQVSTEKECESETVENLRPSVTTDVPMPSPEAKKNEAEDIGVVCSMREKLDIKEEHLSSNELSNDSNGSRSNPKATTPGPVDEREDAQTCSKDVVPSMSSSCKLSSLTEQCMKCFRKRRLEYDALKQELCCCLSDSMDDVDMSSVYKDREEGETFLTVQCAEKHGENVRGSEPPVDGERGTCFACKSAGMLLHCGGKGCTRSYHASCLMNPDENEFLPMWYCCECTKKRLALGVHSVSEGIESIWGVREVKISSSTGGEKQKQYFVKYKGLAHIHNHWVPELQLLHEIPELLAKFCEKKEGTQWKPEWVVPHRLLKQRVLDANDFDKHSDRIAGTLSNGQHEWLVKWCGLDHDQATWEFQDSSCFKAPDLQQLIREYETRHERARTPVCSGNEIQERRKGSHVKAGRVSGGASYGVESCYMNSVNKLREYHNKRHNAVLLDEQDRIAKVVYLVSSIVINICRPILIIGPCASLSFWEAEFSRLAAPINVVVYGGSTGSRNIIRSLEFYEGDNIMLQVLLSSPEVVSEDLDVIKDIEWEAVVVDDCQQSCLMAHSGSIKNLVTDWRLLLVNGQLKDDVTDYVNILSLLESGGNSNQNSGLMVDSCENITVLKERLSSFIICARFLEYWVPVQISNLQLEQYCSLILSNRTILPSCSRSDPVGSLRDILISTRKCCDHPYVVDPSLQTSLFPGLMNLLDLGTKASGKLTLLDELLSEFKNQKLKVLILFQSIGGSARDSKGDIIEDFLGLRFGSNSYERVDGGCQPSAKQAALNKFNKEKERPFLLLETRACLPSIKLSSVDAVIIFDSDWNPLNDMRALQKITIDSKLEQIKVFRLYCCCTVEEKVLILAKNDTILDSTLHGISRSTSHKLLMWGSSYLFTRLDEFHHDTTDCKDNIVPGNSFLQDVSKEILSVVQNHEIVNQNKFISVARQNGGGYLKNIALVGEQKIQLEDGGPPHLFWMKLLEGKQPQWKYLSGSSQRNRKRVQYQELEDQDNEVTKKNRKMDRTKVDSTSQHTAANMEKSNAGKRGLQDNFGTAMTNKLESMGNIKLSSDNNMGSTSIIGVNDIPGALPDERKNLYTEQWGLFQLLKPAISRLCETLQLTDGSKRLAEQFLEYVLKNHRVMAEPEAILHAFQISVCWSAVEALDQKIDHKKSLDVARECMNFKCREEEAEAIYSKTKMFMKIFVRRPEGLKISDSPIDPVSATNGITRGSKEHDVELERSLTPDGSDKQTRSFGQTTDSRNDILRHIKKVKKKCDKLLERLKDQQKEELEKFEKECEDKRAELEKKYKVESTIILSIHGKSSIGVGKLKILDKNCAKEKEDLELQISTRHKELEARLQIERDEQQKKTAKWLEQVKSLAHNELSFNSPSENGKQLQAAECIVSEQSNASTKHNSDRETSGIPGPDMTAVVSELSQPQENTVISEVPCPGTNEERENHHNDASITLLEVVPPSQEVGLNDMSKESFHVDLSKMQAASIAGSVSDRCGQEGPLEEFPAASTREIEKENNQMESGGVNRATVLETNQVNEASTTLGTEPLPSPGNSLTKQPATDPASETPLSVSQVGYDSCQSLAGGADEQAQHVTEMQNILPQGETSLACSEPMPSNLLSSAGVHGLPSTENSLLESLIRPHAHDQTRIAPSSRLDNHPREAHTSAQGTMAPMQQEGSITNLGQTVSRATPELAVNHDVNANLGQFETHTSTRGTFLSRDSRPNPHVPIFANSRSSDPLQNELERIHKEIDEVLNIHEEMQLRLKSDCDKEIEEIVTQIRKKYDEKLQEAEASYLLKRKELEMNHQKVMMHKILADAFRSKCMDYKAASGMQQGISSSFVEHVSRMQPAAATPSSTSAVLSSVIHHNGAPASRATHPSTALGPSSAAQAPHISSLGPISGHPVRSAIRAPPPHLQPPFRSASMPVSSSNTPPASNPLVSSPAPQFPPRPSPIIPNSHIGSHQARSVGSTLTVTPLSPSAAELLMEIGMQNEDNLRGLVTPPPTLPDSVQNSGSQHIPRFETTPNLQMPSSSLGAGNNVVCLSDDE